jgi:hypothetical protein
MPSACAAALGVIVDEHVCQRTEIRTVYADQGKKALNVSLSADWCCIQISTMPLRNALLELRPPEVRSKYP